MKTIFSMNSRGQESAPFELLIAVILMGFVILIGTSMLQDLQLRTCLGNVDKALTELSIKIESIAKGTGEETFSFYLDSCGPNKKVTIETRQDKGVCESYCGREMDICTLINYSDGYRGKSNYHSISKCVNISSLTVFAGGPTGQIYDCPDFESEGWFLEDLKQHQMALLADGDEGIPSGTYKLFASFSKTSLQQPVVCAYRRAWD